MLAALLEQFGELPTSGSLEYNNSSGGSSSNCVSTSDQASNNGGVDSCLQEGQQQQQQLPAAAVEKQKKPQQQSDRDIAAAVNSRLALGSGPLHGGLLYAEGLLPKVQLHSFSGSSLHTSATAAGASASDKVMPASQAGQLSAAATGSCVSSAGTTAAAGDAEQGGVPAKVRDGWLRSGLYDPFGMLRPQLTQVHRSTLQQQGHMQADDPARPGKCSNGSNDPAMARQEKSMLTTAPGAAATYVSMSAASNQRQLGGFMMPGRQQIKQQVLQEERQQQQQQQQQLKQRKDRSNNLGVLLAPHGSSGKTAQARCSGMTKQNHLMRSQCNVNAGREFRGSDSDDDGGLRQLPNGAADTVGKKLVDVAGGDRHQWTVPAYSSEMGYIGGLYDEDTGTMYID
jgi:hypothetical protein